MSCLIQHNSGNITVQMHAPLLSAVEAELHFSFALPQLYPALEMRGRLMGPRCVYASTVEVAHPLRPLARPAQAPGTLVGRVVIPEPSYWDTESPFLYEGPIELWSGANLLLRVQVSHGMHAYQLTPVGLRWNGRPMLLRALPRERLDESEARQLRAAGWNTLVTTWSPHTPALCALADRVGLLVIVRARAADLRTAPLEPLQRAASCFAWLLPAEEITEQLLTAFRGQLLGADVRAGEPPLAALPGFLCCTEAQLAGWQTTKRLKLVQGSGPLRDSDTAGLLGVVESES